ncbi:MAG: hypothetical protein M3P96_12200 [Actinomycetota bacterium]|nr:hypothetical protein [Actinomycetota bacterium]
MRHLMQLDVACSGRLRADRVAPRGHCVLPSPTRRTGNGPTGSFRSAASFRPISAAALGGHSGSRLPVPV